jgi:predicted transcriptional regulator
MHLDLAAGVVRKCALSANTLEEFYEVYTRGTEVSTGLRQP